LLSIITYRKNDIGKSKEEFFSSLVEFWDSINTLVQRQEHGALNENELLEWEDGRRVVFHTLILMYEIDRIL
jgi:hypothetical protein